MNEQAFAALVILFFLMLGTAAAIGPP